MLDLGLWRLRVLYINALRYQALCHLIVPFLDRPPALWYLRSAPSPFLCARPSTGYRLVGPSLSRPP